MAVSPPAPARHLVRFEVVGVRREGLPVGVLHELQALRVPPRQPREGRRPPHHACGIEHVLSVHSPVDVCNTCG